MPNPPEHPERKAGQADWRQALVEASPYLGLGMQLMFVMIFFLGVGYLLDGWLETTPWLTIVGAFVGMLGVFAQLFRVSSDLSRQAKSRAGKAPEAGQRPAARRPGGEEAG